MIEQQLALQAWRRVGLAEHARGGVFLEAREHGGSPARAAAGGATSATPIIDSGVTSAASSSSLKPSVPAGRSGTTNQRICALLSHTLTSVSAAIGDAELAQHRARLAHAARAEHRVLVPVRRQAEHRPRVARTQRADDEVVHAVAVRDGRHVLAFGARHALAAGPVRRWPRACRRPAVA